jgi:membrane protein DedA with SNARE-associated domain
MHTLNFFIHIVQDHRHWGYALLFFAMIFEGEIFLVAVGMLVGIRALDPFDSFFFAFTGVLAGDLLWYWLGRYLNHRHSHNKYVDWTIRRVRTFLPGLERNPYHVVFLSKFIYGLNHSAILVLGYLKTQFVHFFRVQFFTSLTWTVLFLAVGYVFGAAAITYAHSLSRFLLSVVLSMIVLVSAERIVKKRIIEKERDSVR